MISDIERKLETLSRHAWDNEVDLPKIHKWRDNFTGKVLKTSLEQEYCLFMLSKFMYFSQRMVREMLSSLYRDQFFGPLRREIRVANNDTRDSKLVNLEYAKQLAKTRFIGAGNVSESGPHLLYIFRQVNDLSVNLFTDFTSAFKEGGPKGNRKYVPTEKNVTRYVIFDDVVGSGRQASTYLTQKLAAIRAGAPLADLEFMCLFATSEGLETLNGPALFNGKAKCLFELDETYKAFGLKPRYFTDAPTWFVNSEAQKISAFYGDPLFKSHPLGYRGGQLLLGFNHNTPNNTLPIFWKKGDRVAWTPIFMRYEKKK
jgi:hypothetical protein